MPPDISAGRSSSKPPSPTRRSLLRTTASISPGVSSVQVASGSATFWASVIEPNSAPDWNSTPQSGACEPRLGGSPSTRISPAIGSASPIRWRSRVDLPLPLPPRIAKISPRLTSKSMFSKSTRPSNPIASPDTEMWTSDPPGIEDQREGGVDDDEREEHRHHRGGRRAAHALGAAARLQAPVAADQRDRHREDDGLHEPRGDVPERESQPRLCQIGGEREVEAEHADRRAARDRDRVADDGEDGDHRGERDQPRQHQIGVGIETDRAQRVDLFG